MYFIVRFNWDKIDCTRSLDRIVGYFDTPKCAADAVINLPYDEFRNAVAIVRFPRNQMMSCAEADGVFMYDTERHKWIAVYDLYIGNQYFYM